MMRRIVIVMLMFFAAVSAHAGPPPTVAADFDSGWGTAEVCSGSVRAVRFSSLQTASATLIVADVQGDEIEFSVRASAVIFRAADRVVVGLKDLKQGDAIAVRYEKTPEGFLRATAVKILAP